MGFDLTLSPYTKKWPKKATIYKVKDEIDFRNFYDFFADLKGLHRTVVPDTLILWVGESGTWPGYQAKSSDLDPDGEEETLYYLKAGDVARLLKKHMKIWNRRIKANKNTSEEELGYYMEYMRKLNRISRMKPSTPIIVY